MSSVLDRRHPGLEYVIVDGGSTDGSAEMIRARESELAWWVSEPDGGHADAINKGFRKTSGEIMGWINSSDLYLPWTLTVVREIFASRPEVDWITGVPCVAGADGVIRRLGGARSIASTFCPTAPCGSSRSRRSGDGACGMRPEASTLRSGARPTMISGLGSSPTPICIPCPALWRRSGCTRTAWERREATNTESRLATPCSGWSPGRTRANYGGRGWYPPRAASLDGSAQACWSLPPLAVGIVTRRSRTISTLEPGTS